MTAGASLLVTDNLDDFPAERIPEGLRVVPTDEFVLELARDDLDVVVDVVETQAAGLLNPPMTASELLDGFEAVGLVQSVAVERLTDDDEQGGHRDPGRHLAEHLGVFVVRGVLPIDHELVRDFFIRGAPDLRGHLHEFLGHGFSSEEPPSEAMERGMALWEARLETMRSDPATNLAELKSFGAWCEVDAVDPAWRLHQLLDVLRLTGGRIHHTWRVLEILEALAESFPSEVLTAVRLITQPTDETWEILAGRDNIRNILLIGLSQERTRGEAESLAHELGARGYTEFRSVLGSA